MARLWSSGFELQSVTDGVEFDSIGYTSPTISTAIKRSGAASLRCSVTTGQSYMYHQFSNGVGVAFFRGYIYIATSLPSASIGVIDIEKAGTTTTLGGVTLKTDGTLQFYLREAGGRTNEGSVSSALSVNTWYRMEVTIDTSVDGAVSGELQLDGVSVATGSATYASAQNSVGIVTFGVDAGGWGETATADLYFDDIAVNDSSGTKQTSWAGTGKIVHLYPNGTGDINECSAGDSTSVDEKPTPDDATSYVVFDADNDDFMVNCEASSTPGIGASDTITLISVGVRHVDASATGATQFQTNIESQASGTWVSSAANSYGDAGTTWRTNGASLPRVYKLTSYVDPQAGGVWTAALLDTMQIGGTCTDATPDFWASSFWALVEYVTAAATGSKNMMLLGVG